jgi:hypothetical protein
MYLQAQFVKLSGCRGIRTDPVARQCPTVESGRPIETVGVLANAFELGRRYRWLLPVAE